MYLNQGSPSSLMETELSELPCVVGYLLDLSSP